MGEATAAIVETVRSLLISGTPGSKAWIALTWCIGILVVFYLASLRLYRARTISA